jgi:hypothetical protein
VNKTACLACRGRIPKRGRPRCPVCRYAFKGTGWDGVEAHWKARHLDVMPYRQFWDSLCAEHRAADPLACPCCRKGIPVMWVRQCPECALVFQGRGWAGIEAHWKANHEDILSYEAFWGSLCPAHRGSGDRASGFLPLGETRRS